MSEGTKYNDFDKKEVHFVNNPCEFCGKPLRRFRNKNGKQTNRKDWKKRTYHLKCWKENKKFEQLFY